ncbi:hypothetical protein [Salinarchaeum laminariae]|uniref:hypothetical protein n=1 Tax=Salinarchaeum laminariae TaxID=869888 RepID=UPI0020BF30EA|nr:hypothetical protein [Salinarchaeum laminariae]
MPLQFATLFGAGLAVAGAVIAVLGVRHCWQASAVLRAPHAGDPEAGDAPMVRFDGTVAEVDAGDVRGSSGDASEPSDTATENVIAAPFSGFESVVVRHVVEERQINPGVGILQWDVVIEEGVESVPFELQNGDSTVTIDGAIGSAILDRERIARVSADDSPPEHIRAFQEEIGLRERPLAFGRLPWPLGRLGRLLDLGRRTYSEERLDVGDSVTVVGHPVGSGTDRLDPLVVSGRSAWRTFLSMTTTGLVALLLGLPVLVLGLVVLPL